MSPRSALPRLVRGIGGRGRTIMMQFRRVRRPSPCLGSVGSLGSIGNSRGQTTKHCQSECSERQVWFVTPGSWIRNG